MDLKQHIKELMNVADILSQYTFPNKPREFEKDIFLLRARVLMVNGYNISLSLLKESHKEANIYVLQVRPMDFPVLPFNYLLKEIVVKFLGSKGLLLNEFWVESKKLYNWSVSVVPNVQGIADENVVIPFADTVKKCTYNGIEYFTISGLHRT